MIDITKIDFTKGDGLVPAIIQDANTRVVLMLGYMNEESLTQTMASGKVTFYSRSKSRLWTKGEESGHFLHLVSIEPDCDSDTLLVKVNPEGPVCHTGSDTCWKEDNRVDDINFLPYLSQVIRKRRESPSGESYTSSLFARGINKIAQKVGEEAVETIIEAKDDNDDLFKEEVADLIFHLLVLLEAKDTSIQDVIEVLKKRHG